MIARQYRLRREGDVRLVRKRGRATADGPLVARILPNDLDPVQNRYTVVAGKRCGNAVQRNRLKRLVREAVRQMHPDLKPGYDVVVICRGTVEEMPCLAEAQRSMARIFRRAGLLVASDAGASPPKTVSPSSDHHE